MAAPSAGARAAKIDIKSMELGNKSIWSTLLDSVANGKKLPEKTLLILGGTVESQKEFVEALSQGVSQQRKSHDQTKIQKPVLANQFALGYTYQDVLDADQDDVLARLSVYLLADPDPAFSQLLKPLFTAKTIPNMMVVILLDWATPWSWLRDIRGWIRTLRSVLGEADDDCKAVISKNMKEWQEQKKGISIEGVAGNNSDVDVTLPVGPGQWDEALGVPLCVICQHAEQIANLERDHGWKDPEFDSVLQYLRTVLLKHGASLIYTATSASGSLQNLVRSILGIHSLLQRNPLKVNVIDRDKVLVPPSWDTWGNIRALQADFDVERISSAWSNDLRNPPEVKEHAVDGGADGDGKPVNDDKDNPDSSAVSLYEAIVRDPDQAVYGSFRVDTEDPSTLEVECEDTQSFLARMMQQIEQIRIEDEESQKARNSQRAASAQSISLQHMASGPLGSVNDHIGPVQLNVGGIQVDADLMLNNLKERQADETPKLDNPFALTPDGRVDNDKLKSFFATLGSKGAEAVTSSTKHD